MAHYRKVDSRIWNDEKFRALSERGKLSFLFILTNPHTTMIGTLRGTLTGLAAELHATSDREHGVLEGFGEALLEGYIKSFRETIDKGLVRYDERACLIWMPNFLKYNSPESPNVIKSWPKAFDMVSECDLKHSVFARMKEYTQGLTKAFHEAFTKAFGVALPKAMPNQEQEQEQDKNLNNTASQYCLSAANSPAEVDAGLELKILQADGKYYPITASQIEQWKALYPMVDVVQEIRAMIGWTIANPKKRKTKTGMSRFVNSWLTDEQKKAAEHRAQEDATMCRRNVGAHKPKAAVEEEWRYPSDMDAKQAPVWDAVKTNLAKVVNRHSFDTWIKPTKGKGAVGKKLIVAVPTQEFQHLTGKYAKEIAAALPAPFTSVELIAPTEVKTKGAGV